MKKRISKKQVRKQAERIEADDILGSISTLSLSERIYKAYIGWENFSESFRQKVSAVLDRLIEKTCKIKSSVESIDPYGSYVKWDDASESFRQTISEMLDDIIEKTVDMTEFTAAMIKKSGRRELAEHHLKKYREHKMRLYVIELKHRSFVKAVERFIDRGAEFMLDNKRQITIASTTVLGVFMAFCVTVNAGTVYQYSYHGEELGAVKDKAEITQAASLIKEDVTATTGKELAIKADPMEDITYKKTFDLSAITGSKTVDSTEEAANKIANCEELEGEGFVIRIDGEDFAFVDTQATADAILEQVKADYCTVFDDPSEDILSASADTEASENTASDKTANIENKAAKTADSKEKAEVDPAITRNIILAQLAKKSALVSAETEAVDMETGAIDAVSAADSENEAYDDYDNVEKYEGIDFTEVDPKSLEGISADNVSFVENVEILPVTAKVSQFMDYDNAIKLFIDDEGHSTALTVRTSEIVVYSAPVNYITVYENSDEMFEGETEVVTPGENGEKKVVAYITKEDGTEVGNTVLYEEMTKEAVTAVIKVGTKDKPSTEPSGHYIVPTNGHLTSHFGPRWGRMHSGIDLAASQGTAIVAADGGTVTFAGYNSGGYGNMVKISHGNGVETRYAHCSEIDVSVGDKVAQGQLIAKVGNTGRSYGSHCHFEIRINGEAVDPLKYL